MLSPHVALPPTSPSYKHQARFGKHLLEVLAALRILIAGGPLRPVRRLIEDMQEAVGCITRRLQCLIAVLKPRGRCVRIDELSVGQARATAAASSEPSRFGWQETGLQHRGLAVASRFARGNDFAVVQDLDVVEWHSTLSFGAQANRSALRQCVENMSGAFAVYIQREQWPTGREG